MEKVPYLYGLLEMVVTLMNLTTEIHVLLMAM